MCVLVVVVVGVVVFVVAGVVVVVVVVVVVLDTCLDVRCVWSQRHGNAMSPRTNLHVAGHLGGKLPATPPPPSPRRRRTLRRRGLPKNPPAETAHS